MSRNTLIVKGTVVAYAPLEQIRIYHPYHELLIVRVDRYIKGRVKSKYVKVR